MIRELIFALHALCGTVEEWDLMGVTPHALVTICGSDKPCTRVIGNYCVTYVTNDTFDEFVIANSQIDSEVH